MKYRYENITWWLLCFVLIFEFVFCSTNFTNSSSTVNTTHVNTTRLNTTQVNTTLHVNHINHGNHGSHVNLLMVLSPWVFLMVGAFIKGALSHVPIPYTVILLLFGFVLGLVADRTTYLGSLGQSTTLVGSIDPHLFLYLFLPPLIFESAFSLEYVPSFSSLFYIFNI